MLLYGRTFQPSEGRLLLSLPGDVVYSGSIAAMPDDHASRRERFAEIDALQPGWTVELRPRGSTVDASFVSPAGVAHPSVVPEDCGKLWMASFGGA